MTIPFRTAPRPGLARKLARLVRTGQHREARLTIPGGATFPTFPLAADLETLADLMQLNVGGDDAAGAALALLEAGKYVLLQDGARLRVLEYGEHLAQVEVADGPYRGRVGWLPAYVLPEVA